MSIWERVKHCWMNGELVDSREAKVHISTPFVTMAIAVFEGIRAYWVQEKRQLYIFRLDDHLDRLFESAKILRLSVPYSKKELADSVRKLLSANDFHEDVYCRVFAYLGGLWHEKEKGEVCMFAAPRPSDIRGSMKGIKCNVSSWRRIPDSVMPPRSKAVGNYVQWQLALGEARAAGFDNTILLTVGGKVSEAPGANIFVARKKQLLTPSRTCDILEGITRETILTISQSMGIQTGEREIDKTELYVSDEVFLCGTGAEITPVVSVDNIRVSEGQPGTMATKIAERYLNIATGRVSEFSSWLTPTY